MGETAAESIVESVFAVEVDALAFERRPYRAAVAEALADAGQYGAEVGKVGKQAVVVHAVERQSFHFDHKAIVAAFVIHHLIADVLADFRQKIRCRCRSVEGFAPVVAGNLCSHLFVFRICLRAV